VEAGVVGSPTAFDADVVIVIERNLESRSGIWKYKERQRLFSSFQIQHLSFPFRSQGLGRPLVKRSPASMPTASAASHRRIMCDVRDSAWTSH